MAENQQADIEVQRDMSQEKQQNCPELPSPGEASAFKSLAWLDRYLAIWIFLAMVVGILLGNFVPRTEEVLDKGRFVGVSIPIGMWYLLHKQFAFRHYRTLADFAI